jgi:hypothetical protein
MVRLFVGCAFGPVASPGRVVHAAGYCRSVLGQYFISQSVRGAGCTEVLKAPHKPLAEVCGLSFDFILA